MIDVKSVRSKLVNYAVLKWKWMFV